jgi:hypothetical protein
MAAIRKFDELYNESNHIAGLLHNLIDYLSNTKYKGTKYKTRISKLPNL